MKVPIPSKGILYITVRSAIRTAVFLMLPLFSLAQNNSCSTPTAISSNPTCINTGSTLVGATYTAITGACGTSRPDVWFLFTAKSTNPTITVSGALTNARIQVYTAASCVGPAVSVICIGSGSGVATPLVIGNQYLIRIYQNSGSAATFNICVVDPAPANDNCTGTVVLTSGTTCVNTTGNMYAATLSGSTISTPNCASSVVYDVWYSFVAQTTNPTITLSNVGSSFLNPALQLLSNNCGGTFTPLMCGTTSLATDFLTPGTTYFIRVYSSSGAVPTAPTNAGFDICVQDPVVAAPYNDECLNATNLPIWNTCNNIAGTMAGATASATPLGACAGPLAYDVWYKFTAINTTATITLSSIGANFLTPRIQMFSGTCGSLTSIFCGTSPLAATGLTAGNTYYVRVYSTTAPAPNGNARFNICATTSSAPLRFGNSYVNLSKRTTGGVVEPGDTLEIRMTVNHTSGTMYAMRYVDNIPTNTAMLAGTGDSIRVITNEGLTFRHYSPAAGDDAASYLASPPGGEYNIRMNLAFGATAPGIPTNNTSTESASATGQMVAGSDRPRGGGGMLFATSYRVVVNGISGDTITLNAGQFIYKTSVGGADITLTSTPYQILISDPLSLCTNSIGINNAVESGGTFGTGSTLNRTADLTTPIAGYTFISDVSAYVGVNDGRYAVVKNLSPRSGTVRDSRRQNTCNTPSALAADDLYNCNNRMFNGFWYIDGDHSNTTNATGNTPPSAATNAGYMLMVNADYVASEAYRQTVTNLCPSTYYEFSAWIRNICPTCGIDSSGVSTYRPGVFPNLSFSLDGIDYYSTGEVDTLGWLKKGFVFKTTASQTSATFTIRNNSQGGGGNDWALDDIAIATCFPNMTYSPTYNPPVCQYNPITIHDTVRSYFDNYVEYKWQRSTDGGANWTDIAGTSGTATPVWNGTAYEFICSYTIPPIDTGPGNEGDLYRLVVASTASNLNSTDCSYTDPTSITLNVLTDCEPVLTVDLLSASGRLVSNKATITWTTSREDEPVYYAIEKSTTGNDFVQIATVNSYNSNAEINNYSFTDPSDITFKVYYRVVIVTAQGKKKYSQIIPLSPGNNGGFLFGSVANPFNTELQYEIISPQNGYITIALTDGYGKVVRTENQRIYAGSNSLSIYNTSGLPAGLYILRGVLNGNVIYRKVIKESK